MSKAKNAHHQCIVCGKSVSPKLSTPTSTLRLGLVQHIAQAAGKSPEATDRICHPCRDSARVAHLAEALASQRGQLSALETDIAGKAAQHETIAEHIGEAFDQGQTLGQRLADRVAAVGGSWPFVIGFGITLAVWIVLNSAVLGSHTYDPYPYILLNLLLSCLAAIQAPIIMMSQNRSSARDRLQANEDFKVNLKAELEIGLLHAKVDHLLHEQWERMVEMQETQLELLAELKTRRG